MATHFASSVLVLLLIGAAPSIKCRRLMEADNEPTDTFLEVFVPSSGAHAIASELVALVDSIQHNEALMTSALQCSEATGIVSIASDLPQVVFDAAKAFKRFGFCKGATQKEQIDRFTYMLSYAVSLHLRSTLQHDFECENMSILPYQCGLGTLVDDAVEEAALLYRGDAFCSDASTDSRELVELLELPENWEPAEKPIFSCSPRDDDDEP